MITRERLIAGMEELVHVEEGLVGMFANYSKALLAHADDVPPEKKQEINKLLTRLYKDSAKHRDMIDGMMRLVGAEDKNEY